MLLHCELQYEIAITVPTMFLQIANVFRQTCFSKSPNTFSPNRQTRFLQITEWFFSKSPNTSSPNHRTHFLQIANVFRQTCFSRSLNIFLQISKIFRRSASSILSFLFSSEKTQSPISPYMCHGLRALRYGWSAMVPWSRLFLLTSMGSTLDVMDYGLAKAKSTAQN